MTQQEEKIQTLSTDNTRLSQQVAKLERSNRDLAALNAALALRLYEAETALDKTRGVGDAEVAVHG